MLHICYISFDRKMNMVRGTFTLIKNYLVSSSAQANLLSHKNLCKALVSLSVSLSLTTVCILIPNNETDLAVLYWGNSNIRSYYFPLEDFAKINTL